MAEPIPAVYYWESVPKELGISASAQIAIENSLKRPNNDSLGGANQNLISSAIRGFYDVGLLTYNNQFALVKFLWGKEVVSVIDPITARERLLSQKMTPCVTEELKAIYVSSGDMKLASQTYGCSTKHLGNVRYRTYKSWLELGIIVSHEGQLALALCLLFAHLYPEARCMDSLLPCRD